MNPADRPDTKYLPHHCTFLQRQVWAILTKQPDGHWQVVNCLDKEEACFGVECFF